MLCFLLSLYLSIGQPFEQIWELLDINPDGMVLDLETCQG